MTVTDINPPDHGIVMTMTRVTVTLPPWVAQRLGAEIEQGRYSSLEDAVLAGAQLVAGLGPRAKELLGEGAGADGLVRAHDGGDRGDWL